MHVSRIRVECLKMAVTLCQVANAFDRPERVLELARQFEGYCTADLPDLENQLPAKAGGEPPAPEQPKAVGKGPKAGKEDPRKFLG